MIPIEAWQAFAGMVAIIILLGHLVTALQKFGIIKPRQSGSDEGLAKLRSEFEEFRRQVEKHYISEDTWTAPTSRILGILERQRELQESQGHLLIRLDERLKSNGV